MSVETEGDRIFEDVVKTGEENGGILQTVQ